MRAETISRITSEAPAKIESTRESRSAWSIHVPSVQPAAPWKWTQRRMHVCASSQSRNLAMEADAATS